MVQLVDQQLLVLGGTQLLVEQRLQAFFAQPKLLQQRPRFILPSPPSEGALRDTDKRRRMEGALQEADIAENVIEPGQGGGALHPSTPQGKQYEGEIRPGRLTGEAAREAGEIRTSESFLGHERQAGTLLDRLHKGWHIRADLDCNADRPQDVCGHGCIPPAWRKNERPLRIRAGHVAHDQRSLSS